MAAEASPPMGLASFLGKHPENHMIHNTSLQWLMLLQQTQYITGVVQEAV